MSGLEREVNKRVLPPAEIEINDGRVHCRRFADIYHPPAAAAAARAVFVDGNDLAARFARASGNFTVAELGFGLGVNFLATVQLWREVAPDQARLHYLAVEGFPAGSAQIKKAHAALGCDPLMSGWLIERLPARWPGWHHVDCGGRISLTLIYQDAADALADADFAADAWFLDGFAPACNPHMWEKQLLGQVARLTVAGGSCATYSSAADVRRNLAAAGFEVLRRPGFAQKREMLCGRKPGKRPSSNGLRRVLVIGAGIAGRCVARSLNRRGIDTQLIASASRPAASQVPRLLQTPRVTASMAAASRLSLACFGYARSQALAAGGHSCGALMLAHNDAQRARQQRICRHQWPASLLESVTAADASDRAGIRIDCDALWMRQAVCADTVRLLDSLVAEPPVDAEVLELQPGETGCVAVTGGGKRFAADALVLCCGAAAAELVPELGLQFSLRPGSAVKLQPLVENASPQVALLYGNVLNPGGQNQGDVLCTSDAGPGQDGLHRIGNWLPPSLVESYRAEPGSLWLGTRSALPDRLPAAGAVADRMHMLVGLGARGYALAFLLAEAVVARMTGELVPLPVSLQKAVDPGRFRVSG